MKKTSEIIGICIFLFCISISYISAINFNYINPEVELKSFKQHCSIENNADLYCKTLITFYILNETNQKTLFSITERLSSEIYAQFDEKSIKLCMWESNSEAYNYRDFNVSCNLSSDLKKELNESLGDLSIDLDLNNLKQNQILIYFEYKMKNFVIKDPVYNTLFFNVGNTGNSTIDRIIILPTNSVIEELSNLEIIAIIEGGKRVIATYSPGDSIAWYRDYEKEDNANKLKELSIILISFSLSIIFGFLFSEKLSGRSKLIWIIAGCFLLIVSFLLFKKYAGVTISIIELIFLSLSFIFIILAIVSGSTSTSLKGMKRQAKSLKRFLISKIALILWLIVILIIIWAYLIIR